MNEGTVECAAVTPFD